MTTGISTLWYEMQLIIRRLWALPFNEGTVGLDPDIRFEVTGEGTHVIANLDPPRPVTAAEVELLRLFEEPQVFGEELFARVEIDNLADARGFLAECMRRGVLKVV